MLQHVNPSLTFEMPISQSMDLRGKKNKYKGKHSVNPSQNFEILIVQSMELRGKKKKYKSKKNSSFGNGDAMKLAQDSGQKRYFLFIQRFLQHQHQMVSTTLVPLLEGNQSKSPQVGNDRNANVFMCDHEVSIKTRSHSYDVPPSTLDQSESQPIGSLTIEKPTIGIVPHPPKGDLCRTMHNPNARVAHNENVVEKIAQAPCSMSSMEVLKYYCE